MHRPLQPGIHLGAFANYDCLIPGCRLVGSYTRRQAMELDGPTEGGGEDRHEWAC
jgi:hypothetical protein